MKYLIGIDEVGRGPLAGPVVLGVVAIPQNFRLKNRKLGIIKDSKKISETQREKWYDYFINEKQILFSVARVYPSQIDAINISRAANRAALRAYKKLVSRDRSLNNNHRVLLDGGLYLGNKGLSKEKYGAKTVIKGDEKHLPIMMASIIAKVTRDRYMVRLAKKYPGYGFELHKGYGTATHLAAIRKKGPTPAHRMSFLKFLHYEMGKNKERSRR